MVRIVASKSLFQTLVLNVSPFELQTYPHGAYIPKALRVFGACWYSCTKAALAYSLISLTTWKYFEERISRRMKPSTRAETGTTYLSHKWEVYGRCGVRWPQRTRIERAANGRNKFPSEQGVKYLAYVISKRRREWPTSVGNHKSHKQDGAFNIYH